METYHKIQTLFKRDMDGSRTGKKGKMIRGEWTTPELEYLAGNEWEFTEKVDGTNIRIQYRTSVAGPDGFAPLVEFGGRTDRAVLPKPLMEYLEETFTPELFSKTVDSKVLLFGEGYGAGIQSGGNYQQTQEFVLFDVKIGDFWLTRDNVDDIAKKLGIASVPVLGHGTLFDAIDIVSSGLTWDRNGKMTNWGGYDVGYKRTINGLQSTWGKFEAEGIVARPRVALFDRKGERIITKIKGVDFR